MRLIFHVGGDEVGPLGGDPGSPGNETCVTLSAECMESFAEFRRGLRVGFDGGLRHIFPSDRVIPLPAISEKIRSIGYSLLGVGTRTYVLLKSHDREKGLKTRIARQNKNVAIIRPCLDG